MLIAHTGDWHITEGPRFESTLRCLDFIVAEGTERRVDLWLVPGDLTGTTVPHKMTILERITIADILQRMAQVAPVVVVYGNHDFPGDLEIFSRLRAPFTVHVASRPETFAICGARVYCLPYPQKRFLVAQQGMGAVEQQNQVAGGLLRAILMEWSADRREHADKPAVLAAHLNIGGSRVAGGEVLIGQEIELAPIDLEALGVDYAALSHIHLHQQMASNAWYAGSPDRSNFGETDEKGFLLACISPTGTTVERVLTPARRLVTVHCEWGELDGQWCWTADDVPAAATLNGTEVRLRVDVPEEGRANCPVEKLEAQLRAEGALNVKRELRIIPKVRVRSEAIRTAHTTAEKLTAWFDSVGTPSEQRTRVLEKLAVLERGEPVSVDEGVAVPDAVLTTLSALVEEGQPA